AMNILFIDIDTLRPDHMGCYGYSRNTTPNMDTIAEEGIKFNNYYCANAPCLPSRAGLATGMFGIHSGAEGHGGTAADKRLAGYGRGFRDRTDENNLFNVFRKAGMHTVSFSTFAERHSSWWFNAGFNETYNVGGGGMESAESVYPAALDWLDRRSLDGNWFMHFHIWDPHTPYRAPEEFGNPFEDQPLDNWIDEDVLKKHLKHVGPHSVNELNMYNDNEGSEFPRQPGKATDLKGVKRIFDGYDCGIRYADRAVGLLFDRLKALGIYENTAVIITSDHGENMGELGIYSEYATADRATCRIPMIIKWPGLKGGRETGSLHYNIDLAPTMAEMLKTRPFEKWDGLSYAKTLTDDTDCGHEYLVISQMAHVCQRSVVFGDWLYMRTYHDGFHLFDKEMLFNLKDDPYEQFDVKEKYPEICNRAAKCLLDWHDNMMASSDSEIDPLWTVMKEGGPFHARGHLERYCERLEQTGRGEGAEILRKKDYSKWLF
ncbi:MAG: sulfatase, partial [Oscillospiraceae bacterium]|nr:sulfatase [Oscillospiraceae bacterium]